jgi:hypothetical protein
MAIVAAHPREWKLPAAGICDCIALKTAKVKGIYFWPFYIAGSGAELKPRMAGPNSNKHQFY